MDTHTTDKRSLSLKWIYLAWFGLIFSSLVIGTIASAYHRPPELVVSKWGIGDFSIFAISLYCMGSIIAVAILYFLLKAKGCDLKEVGLKGNLSFRGVAIALIGVVIAFITYPTIEALLKPIGVSMFWQAEKSIPLNLVSALDFSLVLLFAVLIGPIAEEIIFRGYLLTAFLQRKQKMITALLLSALIFSSIHIYLGPGVMVFIFFWAFIPAFLYLKFKSLYPAIIFHMVNNFITYIIFPLWYR